MTVEPATKRVIAFFDGQNLFHAAKNLYGYKYPNYDPLKLAQAVCDSKGWHLVGTRFYTGIPAYADNPKLNQFWASKLGTMGRCGIKTFTRHIKYQQTNTSSGKQLTIVEKGIDVRITIDVITNAFDQTCDIVLVFSQDQDLMEVADEIKVISERQKRWLKMASAFPCSENSLNKKGIRNSLWIPIDRATYDNCIDHYNKP